MAEELSTNVLHTEYNLYPDIIQYSVKNPVLRSPYSETDLFKFIEENVKNTFLFFYQTEWIKNIIDLQKEEDENILKETKRRNILLSKKIYNQKLWSYNLNINIEEILDLINPFNY